MFIGKNSGSNRWLWLVLAHLDWLLQRMSRFRLQRLSQCILCIYLLWLSFCRYLLAEGVFDKTVISEQQAKVGGLWNYTLETHDLLFKVPLTNANVQLEQPVYRMEWDQREPVIIMPVYDDLEKNIPHPL